MTGFFDRHLKAMAEGYANVLFSSNPAIGVALFFATFFNPNVAVAGVVAVMSAHLFACAINFDMRNLELGCYTFNPLLTGMAVGYVFALSPVSLVIIATAGILAFVITIMLSGFLYTYLKLPALSLPFVLTAFAIYLAAAGLAGFNRHGFYPYWDAALSPALPIWLKGFFESFGMIFFLPHVVPGMLIAATVLVTSRILFMTGAAGYLLGTMVTGLLEGSFVKSFEDPFHFNFIVIAMALGGVFAIPSIRSYSIAAAAVCIAALAQKATAVLLASFGLSVLALPFNVITLLFLYALGTSHYKHITKYFMPTPEETLDHYLSVSRRFKQSERTIRLPFAGEWTVWQGFDGEWTHKAEQKFAYDFIIVGENGESHANGGGQLPDYYAYQKSVLSPVRGYVTKVVSGLADNPIGQVDKTNTWGNYVVVFDERGFHAAISHLMKDSVAVKEGDWVERGAFIGKCGNSGYSPQPHIHVQAQAAASITSKTLPFSFASYTEGNEFRANGLPPVGAAAAPLFEDKSIEKKTSFMIGDRFRFETSVKGVKNGELALTVKSAPDGTFYFDSGRGVLYFGKLDGAFYTYRVDGNDRFLEAMFMALPRMPLGWRSGLTWCDHIPANMAYTRAGSSLLMLASSFHHDLAKIKTELAYSDQDTIEGRVFTNLFRMEKKVRVEMDDNVGFKTIIAGDIELRRINNEMVRG